MYRPKIMPPRIFIVMQARAGELLLRARRAAEREQEFILAMMQQLVVGLLIFSHPPRVVASVWCKGNAL